MQGINFIFSIAILILSVVVHEVSHGYIAYLLGDPTAKRAGRLSMNPLKHLDLTGSFIVPLMLVLLKSSFVFGWAKPVPVMFSKLKNPKRDMIWVGLSGPAINIAIAVLLSRIFIVGLPNAIESLIEIAIYMNILLAVFNLIPIPPLDGSRIVMGLLPDKIAMKYSSIERYGILIVFGLLYLGAFKIIVLPIILVVGKMLGVDF